MLIKQICLITDGRSNVGISPVIAAAQAASDGICVNVVGVVDAHGVHDRGIVEIEAIAKAGKGLSHIVHTRDLSRTVQMVTRKAMTHTLHQVVNEQLQRILTEESRVQSRSATALPAVVNGEQSLTQLAPEERAKVVQVIDDMSEQMPLRVALLIDVSASMRSKLEAVRTAIHDLMLSLQARSGESEIAVFHFPHSANEVVALDAHWTSELANVEKLFYKLSMKGTTPTGPAMLKVIRYITDGKWLEDSDFDPRWSEERDHVQGDGMFGEYIF